MCCGINGPMDWVKITSLENDTVLRLPDSCCAIYEHDKCIALKGVGCLNQLEYLISQCGFLFSGTVLTIAVIQVSVYFVLLKHTHTYIHARVFTCI